MNAEPVQLPYPCYAKTKHQTLSVEQLQRLKQLYENQAFEALGDYIIACLEQLNDMRIAPFSETEEKVIPLMLRLIVMVLLDSNFRFTALQSIKVIKYSDTIGSLLHLFDMPNTDDAVSAVHHIKTKPTETLLLYSVYNTIHLNLEDIGKTLPQLITIWFEHAVVQCSVPTLHAQAHQKQCELLNDPHLLNHLTHFKTEQNEYGKLTFSQSTYIDESSNREFFSVIHNNIRKTLISELGALPEPFDDTADRKFDTIVVVSNLFRKQHAVYRSISPLVYAWKGHFKLHFASFEGAIKNKPGREIDEALFDEIHTCDSMQSFIDLVRHTIKPGIIFYPDIGLTSHSVMASNLRLAPIQCAGYGHPVSQFPPEIDYYIGSLDAEIADDCQTNYSEKMVLIEGVAALPVLPEHTPTFPNLEGEDNPVCISLAWGRPKIQASFLQTLAKLLEKTSRPIHFGVSGIQSNNLAFLKLQKWLEELFGKAYFTLYPTMPTKHYYPVIEHHHFGIDSYFFGGYNRVIDSLVCGRPIIALEGDKCYNRVAAVLLRQLDLDALVATTEDELIDIALRLIEDDAYRIGLTDYVRSLDILDIFTRKNPAEGYLHAVRAMINDYQAGNMHDKTPLIISNASPSAQTA